MAKDLVLRQGYQDDGTARRAFKDFLILIFGLDLSRWDDCGFWDELYRPFSFFDANGRVVSSVCLYSMDMMVEGRPCRAAQISAVGTLPELRRQGLNRRLTEVALDWAAPDHEFVFLFSAESAIPFYEKLGFRPAPESRPIVRLEGGSRNGFLRRLDMNDAEDRALMWRFANERTPVSSRLGVDNPRLLMFHALYTLADHLYHIPELEAVVSFRRDGDRIILIDVIGRQVPTLDRLTPFLPSPEPSELVLSFLPDRLEVETVDWRPYPDNNTFDRGDIPLRDQPYLFPFTAHA